MALFEFLSKAKEKAEALQKKAEAIMAQPNLTETAKSNIKQPKLDKPNSQAKKIISMFYSDYPEIPYIANDRKPEWIDMAASMPKTVLVQRNMMVRFNDGLLPGHIYMLYWLNKYTDKKVPSYFEYKYGINFDSEKAYLQNNGFLNDMDKPTEKGLDAINSHTEVITNHSPKPDRSIEGISKQILSARDNMLRNGFAEYEFIANSDCCSICARLNGRHFPISKLKIGVNAPPMHEGCRCSVAAYEDDAEYEAWLDDISKKKKQ